MWFWRRHWLAFQLLRNIAESLNFNAYKNNKVQFKLLFKRFEKQKRAYTVLFAMNIVLFEMFVKLLYAAPLEVLSYISKTCDSYPVYNFQYSSKRPKKETEAVQLQVYGERQETEREQHNKSFVCV